ncbi:Retrovirus-related Pol polyprotein from transposon RE2-like protein [Drosera capensis]
MTQPPRFVVQEETSIVCCLKRSLYGLKQSPRVWFGRLSQTLSQFGMTRSAGDHSVFYRHLQEKTIIQVAYVNDLIIIGDDVEGISILNKFLREQFQIIDIIDLNKVKYFLGIEVLRSPEYELLGCKPIDSPMVSEINLILENGEPLHDPERYQRLIEKLNYLIVTRPDIIYPVSVVNKFTSVRHTIHWDSAVRILRYLKGSPKN